MDDALIDSQALSLTRKSLLPGTGFFYPDSLDEERAEERAREAIEGADVVVVTDSDADGLGCLALIREAYGATLEADPFVDDVRERISEDDEEDEQLADELLDGEEKRPVSPVALVPSGPRTLAEDLERAAEYVEDGADVFVCDLCPDSWESIGEAVETLVERCGAVRWFDHHQWGEDVAASVREAGVDLVVGESEAECTADVALRSLDHEFEERFRELVAVTRDHDLWIKDDPRSDDLSDYATWSDAEEYATVVGTYGVDLPAPVEEYIAQRRIEKENLVEKAVDRAEFKSVGPWTVGVTYGRCSQNEVAEALRTRGADAAVIVKPAGSASIRGSEGFERCHEVARQVQGGGHPKAAGCKPDIYDDMLDYAQHWTTQGTAAQRVILAAFERVAERAAQEEADEGVETER